MEILKDHKIATFIPGLTNSQNRFLKEKEKVTNLPLACPGRFSMRKAGKHRRRGVLC